MANNNHPRVLWFFGLSGSGKSTLSTNLFDHLKSTGVSVISIDGDQLRSGINQDLGFSSEDRMENIRRSAELAKFLLNSHELVLASFITPEESHREKVREILGENALFIYVDADLETCRNRDVKGLYKIAEDGKMSNFTGVSAPFERPDHVDLVLDTTKQSIGECIQQLIHTFLPTR